MERAPSSADLPTAQVGTLARAGPRSAPALEQIGHGRDAIDLGGATPGYLFASAAGLLAVLILLLRRRDLG